MVPKKRSLPKFPTEKELFPMFENVIQSVVSVVLDEVTAETSKYLHFWFIKTAGHSVFGERNKTPSSDAQLMIRELCQNIPSISREDLEQQCKLIVLEMWKFYKSKIENGKKVKFSFYDNVRFNLVKHIGKYVGNQILLYSGDLCTPVYDEAYYPDDPKITDFSLGWLLLKSNHGMLSEMTIREKYLLYLRFAKKMTIKEISSLTKRHRAQVESDFSRINKIINLGENKCHYQD